MRGQILLARAVEHRRKAMVAHCLKRVAGRAPFMAIIDQQCRTAMRNEMHRDAPDRLIARWSAF